MKGNLFRKLEALGQQAARLQQAAEQAPAQIGQIARAITLTSSQLVDLKSGLRATFDQLKATGEEQLLQVVREIDESRQTLADAGFALVGLDLELSPAPRVLLRLQPTQPADPELVQRLIGANPQRSQLNGILTALVRSTQVAEKIHLTDLRHEEICVGIGPIPSLRVSWRMAPAQDGTPPVLLNQVAPPTSTPPPIPVPGPATSSTHVPSRSILGNTPAGGFFPEHSAYSNRPTSMPSFARGSSPEKSTPPVSDEAAATPTSGAAPTNPLDRFKKMPDLGRRRA